MRLGHFLDREDGDQWCGAVTTPDTIINLPAAGDAAGIDLPHRLDALLRERDWRRRTEQVIDRAEETGVGQVERATLERRRPIANPSKMVCVGLNYRDHAEEGDNPIPDEPVLFAKFPTAVNDPGGPIEWDPNLTAQVDYEAELVIVMGRETRRVSQASALDHVAGYTAGNDVTARDLQRRDGQWVRGKSLDTFAPIGPDLVTTDEIDDSHDLDIWTEVNGERLQDSHTSNLIFGVSELVSFCSRAFTLLPGDLIFTGTPPGVGTYRDPPVYLEEGDSVTIGIEGIGQLQNTCTPS